MLIPVGPFYGDKYFMTVDHNLKWKSLQHMNDFWNKGIMSCYLEWHFDEGAYDGDDY